MTDSLSISLSLYTLLRTTSVILQLSPFEYESFASCLQSSLRSNPLLDDIHVNLMRALERTNKRNPVVELDLYLISSFTWPEYVCNYVKNLSRNSWQPSDQLKRAHSAACSLSATNPYQLLDPELKLSILEVLIEKLVELFGEIFMVRQCCSLSSENDTVPWLRKGDDGFPEICVLCGSGGDLLCCDFCPATFHASCLHLPTAAFRGEWRCPECAIMDPCRGLSRLEWFTIDGFPLNDFNAEHETEDEDDISLLLGEPRATSYAMIGRYLLEKGSTGIPRALQSKEVKCILDKLSSKLWNKKIWKSYLSSWMRYFAAFPETAGQTMGDIFEAPSTMKANSNSISHKELVKLLDRFGLQFNGILWHNEVKQPSLPPIYLPTCYSNLYRTFHEEPYCQLISPLPSIYLSRSLSRPSDSLHHGIVRALFGIYARLEGSLVLANNAAASSKKGTRPRKVSDWFNEWKPKGWIHRLGALNAKENLNFTSFRRLCRLMLELEERIPPIAFSSSWFLSPSEVSRLLGNLSGKSGSRTTHRILLESTATSLKIPPLRVSRFCRLRGLFWLDEALDSGKDGSQQLAKTNSISSMSIEEEDENHRKFALKRKRVNSDDGNSDTDNVANTGVRNDDEDIFDDSSSEGHEDHPVTLDLRTSVRQPFLGGRRFVGASYQTLPPKHLIRRLARQAGISIVPTVVYPLCHREGEFAQGPLRWHWRCRMKRCSTISEAAYLYRMLEKYLSPSLEIANQRTIMKPGKVIQSSDAVVQSLITSVVKSLDLAICPDDITGKYNRGRACDPLSDAVRTALVNFGDITLTTTQSIVPNPAPPESANLSELKTLGLQIWLDGLLSEEIKAANGLVAASANRLLSVLDSGMCVPDWNQVGKLGLCVYSESRAAIANERKRLVSALLESFTAKSSFAPGFDCAAVAEFIADKVLAACVSMVCYELQELGQCGQQLPMLCGKTGNKEKKRRNQEFENTHENFSNGSISDEDYQFRLAFSTGVRLNCFRYQQLYSSFYQSPRFQISGYRNSSDEKFKPLRTPHKHFVWRRTLAENAVSCINKDYVSVKSREAAVTGNYFLPQTGDLVLYFISGHKDYLASHPDNCHSLPAGCDRLGLTKKKLEVNSVSCVILSIDYEFPHAPHKGDNGILMVIQLLMCRTPNTSPGVQADDNSLNPFYVLFRPGHDSAEFLVLASQLEFCISRNWSPNDKFELKYSDDSIYQGTIVDMAYSLNDSSSERSNMLSWSGVTVDWDGNMGMDTLNEWELEPVGQKESKISVDLVNQHEKYIVLVNSKLVDIVLQLVQNDDFEAFRSEVNDEEAPDYYSYIPVCLYLELLLTRARNNYYRQPAGLLGDVRAIYCHAGYYNLEDSAIAIKAAEMYRWVYRQLMGHFPESASDLEYFSLFDPCLHSVVSIKSLYFHNLEGGNFLKSI